MAFVACYSNHGSASAADFLRKTITIIPNPPTAVQTDNGSEFALHFAAAVEELGFIHYHTYLRSPKMNAHIERFNRAPWEEWSVWHRAWIRDDVRACHEKLVDWLCGITGSVRITVSATCRRFDILYEHYSLHIRWSAKCGGFIQKTDS